MRTSVIIVLLIAAIVAIVQTRAGEDRCPSDGPDLDASEIELLRLLNVERQSAGIAPVTWDAQLARMAAAKAVDNARRGVLDHRTGDGRELAAQAQDCGVSWRDRYAEVIAGPSAGAPNPDAAAALRGWRASPSHYSIILDGRWTRIGVGHAGAYWSAVLSTEHGRS